MLKIKAALLVDCHDLDKFVAPLLEPYGVTWRSLDTGRDGYNNGSMEDAVVVLGNEIEQDVECDFMRWLHGGPFYDDQEYMANITPSINEMLQWLCNEGQISAGHYVVDLWW
jgi:hypothetical protein